MSVYGQIAQAVAPYAVDAIGNMFSGGAAPTYTTSQTDSAMRSNVGFTGGKTNEQLAYEENQRRQRALYDQSLGRSEFDFVAGRSNAAANANTARNMAAAAQAALNNVYMGAGDRLNSAAANTMAAINAAGNTAAGMFR